MADTGTKETLDTFFNKLQVSPGTTQVNTLHAMCLMPLFEDLLGGKLKGYASKDKSFWQKLIDKCFPWLRFSCDTSAMNTRLYTGTGDEKPTGATIPTTSIGYDIDKTARLITPQLVGKYFWVALPNGYSLSRINNLSFAGDYIGLSVFKKEAITINNGQYTLYWFKSPLPFKSTFQIILK